ncbi:MAG: hypothetical protein PVI23_02220 [Maricaulaceae bacterium]|jgi:hypothetical protein
MTLPKLKLFAPLLAAAFAPAVIACTDVGPTSGFGFKLPDGDPELGRTVFANYFCHDCHEVSNDPEIRAEFGEEPYYMTVVLGGETSRIQTYGELVTSIINPSHRISDRWEPMPGESRQSPMRNYNDLLTVRELIDLVAYVQGTYELMEPPETEYTRYNYPR